MSDNRACEVPLIELLRSVPKDQCMSLVTQWSSEGRETGHMHIPVGVLAHRAADELAAAQAKLARIEAAGRELPDVRLTDLDGNDLYSPAHCNEVTALADFAIAQTVRADELQTMFGLARLLCLVNGCSAETFDEAIDEALKERT